MVNDLATSSCDDSVVNLQLITTLKGRILIAEDGEDNQFLISTILSNAGATVEVADNGRVALEKLNAADANGRPFDLLLTDIQMPEMDGYTLASTLRASGNSLPIVALTAHAMYEDRQKCLDSGCNDYASKPINKLLLLATCARWMTQSTTTVASSESATVKPATPTSVADAKPAVADEQPLLSYLADDPEMGPLIEKFLSKLAPKIQNMSEFLLNNRLDELATLAHQLKGAGGSYGFPTISDAARDVEKQSRSRDDMDQLRESVEELSRLCRQAMGGQPRPAANPVKA
jgi:CheY-like chemotaxis protein/HPt (histidine-containing phosphotransfer) domain-containing protein